MNAEYIGGIVRAIVSAIGGYLVGKGTIDSETAVAITGAAVTIATAIWSVWSKKANEK
jgi:RsiW-degrading membrane proteinase PrsW (M82 family)